MYSVGRARRSVKHRRWLTYYSAMEFIQVLRRFFAVCGKPALFLSDNGTQLVEAERELREMIKGWQKKKLKEFVAERELIAVHYTNSASLKWLR